MPYLTVEGGPLDAPSKKALIEGLTATAPAIMHVPAKFFLVTVKELPDENIGIGGKPINEVKASCRREQEAAESR